MRNKDTHPFVELRKKIRQSGSQFRKNDYDEGSIFHQGGEFCYAYDIPAVEKALDDYQVELPAEYHEEFGTITMEDQIVKMAVHISTSHVSMEARDFARTVRAYFAIQDSEVVKRNPLKVLTLDRTVNEEEDTIA